MEKIKIITKKPTLTKKIDYFCKKLDIFLESAILGR